MKLLFTALLALGTTLFAQGPPFGGGRHSADGPPPMRSMPGPMDRAMHAGSTGRWWSDPRVAQELGLSADQQHKMDELFQASRLKLIDRSAAVQKEEAIMEPLLEADHPDEAKVLVQIDRIAQARAELEKANARLLLGLRNVLTQEQWKKLQDEQSHGGGQGSGSRSADRGPRSDDHGPRSPNHDRGGPPMPR